MFPTLRMEPKLKPWAKYAPHVNNIIVERYIWTHESINATFYNFRHIRKRRERKRREIFGFMLIWATALA